MLDFGFLIVRGRLSNKVMKALFSVTLTPTYRRSLISPLPSIINAWLNGQLVLWKPPGNDSPDLGCPRRGRKIIDKTAETWYNLDYEKVYLYFI